MSKPRYGWWPYVKNMIYSYPSLCTLHQQALTQQITPTYSGLSGGSEGSRKTEQTVVRASTQTAAREYEAVHLAIQQTQQLDSGAPTPSAARRWRRTSRIALPGVGTASSSGGWRKIMACWIKLAPQSQMDGVKL